MNGQLPEIAQFSPPEGRPLFQARIRRLPGRRSYGTFLRSFALPENIDENAIRAELNDGVLNVRLNKSAKARPRAVEVKVS